MAQGSDGRGYLNYDQAQLVELARCALSPSYFVNNYCWLEEKETSSIIPFNPYDYQDDILNALINDENILVFKSRRIGASWIAAAYTAWLINFNKGVNVIFISRNEEAAKKLLAKVKFILNNLAAHDSDNYANATKHYWMKGDVVHSTMTYLSIGYRNDSGEYESLSEVTSATTTSESGRGEGATFLFLDEFAFLPNDDETWRASRLTTTRGGRWMAVSTPNGVGNRFHKLCMDAERGENKNYTFFKVHWSQAGMTQDMVDKATEGMDKRSVAQEMELQFIGTEDAVFDPIALAACYRPPEDYPEVELELENYRSYAITGSDAHYYFLGVDSSVGKAHKKDVEKDYNSFIALTKNGIQAHAYHSKEPLSKWAGNTTELVTGQRVYNKGTVSKLHNQWPGFIQIEENGPGYMVVEHHEIPEDVRCDMKMVTTTAKRKKGFIEQLVLAIENQKIIITDYFTYQCMSVYQRGTVPGKFEAPPGYNDDPVIALALAYDALLQHGMMEFSWSQEKIMGLERATFAGKLYDEIELTESSKINDLDWDTNTRLSNLAIGPQIQLAEEGMAFDAWSLPKPSNKEYKNYEERKYS